MIYKFDLILLNVIVILHDVSNNNIDEDNE
jgi:hypothetical protein